MHEPNQMSATIKNLASNRRWPKQELVQDFKENVLWVSITKAKTKSTLVCAAHPFTSLTHGHTTVAHLSSRYRERKEMNYDI